METSSQKWPTCVCYYNYMGRFLFSLTKWPMSQVFSFLYDTHTQARSRVNGKSEKNWLLLSDFSRSTVIMAFFAHIMPTQSTSFHILELCLVGFVPVSEQPFQYRFCEPCSKPSKILANAIFLYLLHFLSSRYLFSIP